MEFIPAIDLLDGNVVRLHKGDYAKVTVYSHDPAGQARRFLDAGAARLHVVDLDGSRSGKPCNPTVVESILRAAPGLKIQVGGGIRDRAGVEHWLGAGVDRVVLGTAAVKSPDLVRELCGRHPGRIIVAVDARDGRVAVEGWLETSERPVLELGREVDAWGAAALLYTVIDRDGTRDGPDIEATLQLQAQVSATVIASGGIGTLEHVRGLQRAGARAAVCGRALYSGAFSLEQGLAVAAGNEAP